MWKIKLIMELRQRALNRDELASERPCSYEDERMLKHVFCHECAVLV